MRRLRSFPSTAFIFDKDGTLVDTERLYYEAYDRMLMLRGARHDRETHVLMMGSPAAECMRILNERHPELREHQTLPPPDKEELLATVMAVRRERGVRAMPGAEAFLAAARSRGIRIALATSASRRHADMDLQELGWERMFEVVVTGDDVTRHKPAPDAYLLAASRLGVLASDCTAFEDGTKGVLSAHAAGMHVVFIRDEWFAPPVPSAAHLVISGFERLLDGEE